MKDRITHHLSTNSMFNSFPSAYTKHHSTETTLIAFHDDLIRAMDKQEVTCLTLLDLSAAFSTSLCWHCCNAYLCGLVSTAMSSLGCLHICRIELLLFHAQAVNHHPHDLRLVFSRVLYWDQSFSFFILLPSLLSSLVSQPENQNHHIQPQDLPLKHHLYADDTQLYISFRPGNFSNAQSCMPRKIASISSWLTSDFLSLNPSKTEFLLIGLPQQHTKVNQPVLHLPDNTTVTPVTNARSLGI